MQGGSSPAARTGRTVWGEPVGATVQAATQPWPGHLPAPAPAQIVDPPHPIQVLDRGGRPVTINDRGAMASSPAVLRIQGREQAAITAWAGPWPQSEAWWEPGAAGRMLRCQLVDVHGRAYVVAYYCDDAAWLLEGLYD